MSMKVREDVDRQSFVRRRLAHRVLGVSMLLCGQAALPIPPDLQLGDDVSGPTCANYLSMGARPSKTMDRGTAAAMASR